MKQIELTEEHKSKLLEMCNQLFTEDEFTFDNDLGDDGFIDRNFLGKNKSNLMWDDEGSHFHWFEFCMTHLQDKIKQLNGFENNPDCDIELMSCWYENHPVDYLYEEFKKLKL